MNNRPPWGVAPTAEPARRDRRRKIMSVKIRVSYTDDEELAGVIRLLSPLGKKWKVARKQTGKYKKAYTEEHRGNGGENDKK